jgi:hypothetical protein
MSGPCDHPGTRVDAGLAYLASMYSRMAEEHAKWDVACPEHFFLN